MKFKYVIFLLLLTNTIESQIITENNQDQKISELNEKVDSLEIEIRLLKNKLSKKFEPIVGRCYASCLMQPQYETVSDYYNIYTGSNERKNGIQRKIVLKEHGIHKLNKKLKEIYRKNGEDEIDDCIYFCYETTEYKYDTILVVIDTLKIKEFERKLVSEIQLVKEQEIFGWREFIPSTSGQDFSMLIKEIQEALLKRGCNLKITRQFDPQTKKCLIEYQKKNNLPIGNLDKETLISLGLQ